MLSRCIWYDGLLALSLQPHIRTPGYLFGCPGVVIAVVGECEDPELAAFREFDAKQRLYRVKFKQQDVWANAGLAYDGDAGDCIVVDVLQPWLQRAPAGYTPSFPPSIVKPTSGCEPAHSHEHDEHEHDEHEHEHELEHDDTGPAPGTAHSRSDVEQTAVNREGGEPRFKPWAEALVRLLVAKGVLTYAAVNASASAQSSMLSQARGPAIVARAWVDPAFKSRLIANAHEAVKELGYDATNPAAPTTLQALENTDTVHNLIVCTLCSCYPQAILGMSPQWYRSRSYRARFAVVEADAWILARHCL